jgi:hypothetical protein
MCAVAIVYLARCNTEKALESQVESVESPAQPPYMCSPKGQGNVYMAYALAVIMPAVSYSVNSDRRLVYVGMHYLSTVLMGHLRKAITGEPPNALYIVLVLTLYLVLPVRMAVLNVYRGRQKYAVDAKATTTSA